MDGLVDELLTLSRVEAGVGAGLGDEVRLAEVVDDVVDDAAFEAEAASRPVSFARDLAALEPSTIRGNAEMLHRALDNVVRNSMRFSPPGGTIAIAGTRDVERRQVALTSATRGRAYPNPSSSRSSRRSSGAPTAGGPKGTAWASRSPAASSKCTAAASGRPTGNRPAFASRSGFRPDARRPADCYPNLRRISAR